MCRLSRTPPFWGFLDVPLFLKVFWQTAVISACSSTLPLYLAYLYPWSCFASPKLRSIVCFRNTYNCLPDLLSRLALTFSLLSSHTCRVTILRSFKQYKSSPTYLVGFLDMKKFIIKSISKTSTST